MACPQKENGYTSIANEIMEALAKVRIPGEARQVLDVIFRQTYGFGRKSCSFKPGFLSKATGMSRQNVNRALRKLEHMLIIDYVVNKADTVLNKDYGVVNNDYVKQYSINKNYELWSTESKKTTYSIKTTPVVNIESLPIKETLKKRDRDISLSSKKSKCLIPDPFLLTEEMRTWFNEQGFKFIEVRSATAEFVDYWRGKGTAMKDWVATWRNGMRQKERWAIERGQKKIVAQQILTPKPYEPSYVD